MTIFGVRGHKMKVLLDGNFMGKKDVIYLMTKLRRRNSKIFLKNKTYKFDFFDLIPKVVFFVVKTVTVFFFNLSLGPNKY